MWNRNYSFSGNHGQSLRLELFQGIYYIKCYVLLYLISFLWKSKTVMEVKSTKSKQRLLGLFKKLILILSLILLIQCKIPLFWSLFMLFRIKSPFRQSFNSNTSHLFFYWFCSDLLQQGWGGVKWCRYVTLVKTSQNAFSCNNHILNLLKIHSK